jgi:hypothetical protein
MFMVFFTGEGDGWTEGDKWAYSFDVVHDIPTLIKHRGGDEAFVKSLDDHFNGGHNEHTNEVSSGLVFLFPSANSIKSQVTIYPTCTPSLGGLTRPKRKSVKLHETITLMVRLD